MKTVHKAGDLPPTTKVLRVEDLRVPIHIASGHFEAATLEELDDLITDLDHEARRSPAWLA
jgi:hypothetical protein